MAMPRPGLPLVHFKDSRCVTIAEFRSVILKARRLAYDDAKRKRAAAAVKTWLLVQIAKKTGRDGGRCGNSPRRTSCRLTSSRARFQPSTANRLDAFAVYGVEQRRSGRPPRAPL
jgi:hypothetical protein